MAVVAGVAVGALLGVLFAPEKGTETRKKITKKSEDTLNAVKDKINEFVDDVSEKFEKMKAEATKGGDKKAKAETA